MTNSNPCSKSHSGTHFIGIGGIGMSGLARLLLEQNNIVTGSDQANTPLIEELRRLGAKIETGHHADHLPHNARVVISTDIPKNNPELLACTESNPVIHRSALLNELMQGHKALLVSGTHGKTTTSSLLATVLTHAGKCPSWAVGGIVYPYGVNSALGSGEYFVAEADESDGSHITYTPYGLILTNIHEDHLNFYKTKAAIQSTFATFINKVISPDHFFWCFDSEGIRELNLSKGVSYGYEEGADLRILRVSKNERSTLFEIEWKNQFYRDIEIPLLGEHNVLNAAAVFGLALTLGLSEDQIKLGFLNFGGAKRRLEIKSDKRNMVVLDDYAHHPNEITATLTALQGAYPERRLVVLFQPHRHTRTRDCFDAFPTALSKADIVIVTDIYAAGETPIEGITAQAIADKLDKAVYVSRQNLADYVSTIVRPFDVVVTMGAGDITKVSDELSQITPKKLKIACLFGGKSREHEVAFMSAKSILEGFDQDLFEVEPFALSKKGEWLEGKEAEELVKNHLSYEGVSLTCSRLSPKVYQELMSCDLAFPILHGTNGEDGTIQGFFETLGIPYIGSGVEGSAVAMNKAMSKKIAHAAGVPVVPFISFTESEWHLSSFHLLTDIKINLTYPLFVKPVHLGSTVGIRKVTNEEELKKGIKNAFLYDREVVVENGVIGREIEVSIFGKGPWFVSEPGEIITGGEVYGYEGKYGANSTKVEVTADLTDIERNKAKELALKVYRELGCDGMARVDMFLTEKGYIFNEANPIPGFTKNSLYPKMCEASGIDFTTLLTRLSELALARKVKQDRTF